MLERITTVRPGEGTTLHLTYSDGATVHADVSRLLSEDPGRSARLADRAVFEQVKPGPRGRSVTWPGDVDLDVQVFRHEPPAFPVLARTPPPTDNPISRALRAAVQASGFSQSEVARRAGMQQPNLARLLDPAYHGHSLNSLRQLAAALGLEVEIQLKRPAPEAPRGR
ncbi:XRE family transcriptional regulator [Deinococcus sonorensis]|uniref:XRE family transcriptional regulator n=2 Tax=Deinococcus sonorensis TaxID=309891 RepID=A0AAU7U5M9_9DEIO